MDNEARKPAATAGTQAHESERPPLGRSPLERPTFRIRRVVLALVTSLVVAVTLLAAFADPLWAAIELAYYRGASTNNAVFLEWATVREVNINGFEILCKRINDPDTVFHPIGSRIALGSETSGATYNFDVTSGLIPGERYCFRLREITSDQTPGEAFDLCGYGLGVTPPPTAPISVEVSIPVTLTPGLLTPTVVTVTQVPGLTPAPTLMPTVDPFATPTFTPSPTIDPFATPTPTIDPFATPTFTVTPTPTLLEQSVSPLATPTGTMTVAVGTDTGAENGSVAQVVVTETPVEEPAPMEMPAETPTETPTVTPTETATPTETVTATSTVTDTAVGAAAPSNVGGEAPVVVIPDSNVAAVEPATATPIYVVVTATPTPLPALVAAPTFTPWPTAAPTQSLGLSNLLVPNTQNLMVGLLCLIFISASGLGALGLVTSVLYMRSQTRRERLPGPVYERRRY